MALGLGALVEPGHIHCPRGAAFADAAAPVTGDDVEPHTLPASVPVRPRPEVILATYQNFRRPWYVLTDSVAGGVHEIRQRGSGP